MQQQHKRRRRWLGALWMLGLILGLFPKTQAQSALSSKNDLVNTYQWDVSLDLYRLLRFNNPVVMVRYAPNDRGAYRFSIGDDTGGRRFRQFFDNQLAVDEKTRGFLISSGYEWHKNRNRHQLYYGADLELGHQYVKQKIFVSTTGEFAPSSSYQINGYAFVGIKYRITKELSLSMEGAIRPGYSLHLLKSIDGTGSKNFGVGHTFNLGIIPINHLNISYHF
jgi:hypothetical protein